MQIDPHNLYEKLVKAGDEWAELNAAAELLEETKKTLVSQLAADSPESSMSAKEAWALRQEGYRRHVTSMVTARKAANKAKVKYDSAKVYVDLLRTSAANERVLLKAAP